MIRPAGRRWWWRLQRPSVRLCLSVPQEQTQVLVRHASAKRNFFFLMPLSTIRLSCMLKLLLHVPAIAIPAPYLATEGV